RFVHAALAAIARGDRTPRREGVQVRRPTLIIRSAVFLATFAALAFPALDWAGVRPTTGPSASNLVVWFFGSGLRVVVIVVFAYIVVRIIALSSRRLEDEIARQAAPDTSERLKRARTLSHLMQNALTAVVVGMAVLMGLRELQIDIVPLLTGAGI